MNVHQHVLLTTTIVIPNVSILGTQAMNLIIGHMVVPVNYQTTWSQHGTPLVPSKISMLPTSTYPICSFKSKFVSSICNWNKRN
jgi:hypothetical protein